MIRNENEPKNPQKEKGKSGKINPKKSLKEKSQKIPRKVPNSNELNQ